MLIARLQTAVLIAALIAVPPVVLAPQTVLAESRITTQRVQFPPSTTGTTLQGSIEGYQIVDYVLNARAGQNMKISLSTNNSASYFNILAPGETEVALFNGSIDGNQYEGTLTESGDYTIRVYLMRSAARRNEVADYRIELSVFNSGNPSQDATVPGTNYNATGDIPCSMGRGQPTRSCPFGVNRLGNGSGTVTVTKPDGSTRAIFFEDGTATGYDQSQADRAAFRATKEGDLNIIRIGSERYEIPDAVIFGG